MEGTEGMEGMEEMEGMEGTEENGIKPNIFAQFDFLNNFLILILSY